MQDENEKVVEEITQLDQQDPGDENTTKVDESKFESAGDDSITKVDLSKPPPLVEDKVEESDTSVKEDTVVSEDTTQEEAQVEAQETPVLEEITDEPTEEMEEIAAEAEEAITESMETGDALPENIQKLVDFMEETGGDLSDYVQLNRNYSDMEDTTILREYYKKTKPHLNTEEIDFLMQDNFSYDEEIDEDIVIRRKKLAQKEQIASAKTYLDSQKSKYYEEIKAGSKLTGEQKKAIDFFDRYNKESEVTKKAAKHNSDIFTQKTNEVFNDKFKGFEYTVGEKKYRFNVNNADEVKGVQSDLNNFTKKFLDKKMGLKDAKGYHKSLFTAMNADAVANHFYEQGRADAMKNSIATSKNINMDPRQSHTAVEAGGIKVRVLGNDSSDFKFKIKNRK